MAAFEQLDQIGEGTYGQVYRARDRVTNQIVALKRIRMEHEKEGFPITAIREIKILKELRHKNIVELKEIVTSKENTPHYAPRPGEKAIPPGPTSIYLVFEYMDHDLTGLMEQPNFRWFQPEHIKCYMKQLLQGLHFCHKNNVLHRDIKGSNLLINNQGLLKLADFGLARPLLPPRDNSPPSHYTNRVITLWYRPPELLLGATDYGPAVDMWSVGCIFAELLMRKPLFPGLNEVDQLECIVRVCGSPTAESWPNAERMPWYQTLRNTCTPLEGPHRRKLRELFKNVPRDAVDLIDRLLVLDPLKRPSASEVLDANYFWNDPMPADPSSLPKYPSAHEFTTKKRRSGPPPAAHPSSMFSSSSAPGASHAPFDASKRSRMTEPSQSTAGAPHTPLQHHPPPNRPPHASSSSSSHHPHPSVPPSHHAPTHPQPSSHSKPSSSSSSAAPHAAPPPSSSSSQHNSGSSSSNAPHSRGPPSHSHPHPHPSGHSSHHASQERYSHSHHHPSSSSSSHRHLSSSSSHSHHSSSSSNNLHRSSQHPTQLRPPSSVSSAPTPPDRAQTHATKSEMPMDSPAPVTAARPVTVTSVPPLPLPPSNSSAPSIAPPLPVDPPPLPTDPMPPLPKGSPPTEKHRY